VDDAFEAHAMTRADRTALLHDIERVVAALKRRSAPSRAP
jgi:hypothetical protein